MGGLTREELDEFAAASQQKAVAAQEAGKFDEEIVPVEVKKKKETIIVNKDEGPRPGTTAEGISGLRCGSGKKMEWLFTANSSGINDGAAAVVVMRKKKQRIRCYTDGYMGCRSIGGVDPKIMGIGPVASTRKVMERTGMSIDDFDLIEANEAFAAQSVAVGKDLGFDLSKLNVNGGAIALGHPVGASGCRIFANCFMQ